MVSMVLIVSMVDAVPSQGRKLVNDKLIDNGDDTWTRKNRRHNSNPPCSHIIDHVASNFDSSGVLNPDRKGKLKLRPCPKCQEVRHMEESLPHNSCSKCFRFSNIAMSQCLSLSEDLTGNPLLQVKKAQKAQATGAAEV